MTNLHQFSRSYSTEIRVFMQPDKVVTKLWAVMLIDYYGIILSWGTKEGTVASRRTSCHDGFDVMIKKKIKTGYIEVEKDTEMYNKVMKQFEQHLVWETLLGRPTDLSEKLMSES